MPGRPHRALERIARRDLRRPDRTPGRAERAALAEIGPALDRGEIALHYQPIVDMRSGLCRQVEALLRWRHPTLGAADPRDVVHAARAVGELHRLALWSVTEAARARAGWLREGLDLTVAVNLTGDELAGGSAEEILGAVVAAGARPSELTFEVPAARVLRGDLWGPLGRLAEGGARIALDDVSAADLLSTSLAVAIHELKIGRALVRRAVADAAARTAVRALIAAARDLGVEAVAVGVEDRATRELLAALRCDLAQGLWMSRPLAVDDVPRWHSWVARVALGGAAAISGYAGLAREALAASGPATAPSAAPGAGTTCCALRSLAAVAEPGVAMRHVDADGARVLVEAAISPDDEARIAAAVGRDVPGVERWLGATFERPPTVYVFATRASFALALQRSFGQGATDAAALAATNGGVAFPDRAAIAVSWESVRGDAALAITRHELAHLLVHQIAGPSTELPAWFDEGLAALAERDLDRGGLRAARDRSATLAVLRSGAVSLEALSPSREWAIRNAALGGRAYAAAAEAVDLLIRALPERGVRDLLARAGRVGFAQAFGEVVGISPADYSLAFPARFADAHGGPRIAQAETAEGVEWMASGFVSGERLRVVIEGAGYHVEFAVDADDDGTYRAVFGGTAPTGEYRVTATGAGRSASADLRI